MIMVDTKEKVYLGQPMEVTLKNIEIIEWYVFFLFHGIDTQVFLSILSFDLSTLLMQDSPGILTLIPVPVIDETFNFFMFFLLLKTRSVQENSINARRTALTNLQIIYLLSFI